ncbi:MAG: 4-hydroxybutyrate CoA-transferase [Flavobacteriales bacterium]|nr:4-hydroxybutyrate CoA-transferase [Flavobacteriales bacterium]
MNSIYVTADEAVRKIRSGQRVFVHGGAMHPLPLTEAIVRRASELKDVEFVHLHTEGPAPYADPSLAGSFRINSFFVGGNVRQAVNEGHGDYIPVFLSEIHLLMKQGLVKPDVALVQVSPPDRHGFCSLGASIDVALAAIESADFIIAEVNEQAPRTHGAGNVHISRFHCLVQTSRPIFQHLSEELTETDRAIGKYVAGLIEDGATLQMGIGNIPNAVLNELQHHRRLGIHTEMFSDGIIPLVEKGVITGEEKRSSKGKIVSCFALGSQKLYDFIHDNPMISMREASFTNDTNIIRMNPRVTAINSAIEIDLTGQVCADTIGAYQYSGVGGQMDFIRGAALSEKGKPIIALPSITKNGKSKIVPFVKEGAGITTTRAHIHYVITEYGVAYLYGKNLRQRAKALIEIAHPMHREWLEKEAMSRFRYL